MIIHAMRSMITAVVRPWCQCLLRISRQLIPTWPPSDSELDGSRFRFSRRGSMLSQPVWPRAYTPELYLQKCEAVFAHIEKAYPERDLSIYGKDTGLNQSVSL